MSQDENSDALTPVYIPWKTFENYVSSLKGTTIPHQLDGTIRPNSMSGGVWRQLVSAFKFLGYADSEGKVHESRLRHLVDSHGTDDWKATIKDQVVSQYDGVIDGLPIESATPGQLNKRFQDNASVDGQMLKKCVRFYLYALRESGTAYSDHLNIREKSSSTRKRTRRKPRQTPTKTEPENGGGDGGGETPASKAPDGMIDIPLPLGDKRGFIRVPADIKAEHYPIVKAMFNAVKAMAEANSNTKIED